jgi:hypothetical protein
LIVELTSQSRKVGDERYCHSGAFKHRAIINVYSAITATTPNAITYSILVTSLFHFQCNQGRDAPSGRTGNRAPWDEDRDHLPLLSEHDGRRASVDSPVSEDHSIDPGIHSLLEQHLFS